MNTFYETLAGKLRNAPQPLPSLAVGFDGFVDEMISVVGERHSLTSFQAVPDISTFGGADLKGCRAQQPAGNCRNGCASRRVHHQSGGWIGCPGGSCGCLRNSGKAGALSLRAHCGEVSFDPVLGARSRSYAGF